MTEHCGPLTSELQNSCTAERRGWMWQSRNSDIGARNKNKVWRIKSTWVFPDFHLFSFSYCRKWGEISRWTVNKQWGSGSLGTEEPSLTELVIFTQQEKALFFFFWCLVLMTEIRENGATSPDVESKCPFSFSYFLRQGLAIYISG